MRGEMLYGPKAFEFLVALMESLILVYYNVLVANL